MKKIHKILLIILAVLGLCVSVVIISVGYYIPYVSDSIQGLSWSGSLIAGSGAFVCVCFLILFLISLLIPTKRNDLTLEKEKGRLLFSRQTLESTVRYSFDDVEGIISSKVLARIGKQPENTKIYVKLTVKDSSELVDLSETVQGRIEDIMDSSLGISVSSINVRVVEFSPDHREALV